MRSCQSCRDVQAESSLQGTSVISETYLEGQGIIPINEIGTLIIPSKNLLAKSPLALQVNACLSTATAR